MFTGCASATHLADLAIMRAVLTVDKPLRKGAGLVEADRADRRMRAFAALEGLRQTLPLAAQQHGIMQGRVMEPSILLYEGALDDLAAAGEKVEQFRLSKNPDGELPSVMHAGELLARVLTVHGYFTLQDALKDQASQTGAALKSLIGFEVPQQ